MISTEELRTLPSGWFSKYAEEALAIAAHAFDEDEGEAVAIAEVANVV